MGDRAVRVDLGEQVSAACAVGRGGPNLVRVRLRVRVGVRVWG